MVLRAGPADNNLAGTAGNRCVAELALSHGSLRSGCCGGTRMMRAIDFDLQIDLRIPFASVLPPPVNRRAGGPSRSAQVLCMTGT